MSRSFGRQENAPQIVLELPHLYYHWQYNFYVDCLGYLTRLNMMSSHSVRFLFEKSTDNNVVESTTKHCRNFSLRYASSSTFF
mmetsp:Transcript_28874/g.52836  ORF Transcript_28874/g.52836 Transcript_28874/m.52836 type:complete len:83 (-) Transcript_28874:62-310(-)